MHRRVAAVVGVIAVLGIVIGAVIVYDRPGGDVRNGGPLACADCGRVGLGSAIDAGEPFTYGLLDIDNGGNERAVLERVDLLDRDRSVKILGSRAVDPSDTSWASFTFKRGFPPSEYRGIARPLKGFAVRPGSPPQGGAEILVGLQLGGSGQYVFRGIALVYRVGDRRYRAVYRHNVRMCAPRKKYTGRCHNPL